MVIKGVLDVDSRGKSDLVNDSNLRNMNDERWA